MRTIIEPFRIKSVEPIRMTTPQERRSLIADAGYNPFRLKAEHVLIDLLTDSGTGAMSTAQWAGIMLGDESYAGARSFFHFEQAVRDIFGHRHVIPTHQGRASERLACAAVVKAGDVVPGNTHFDTTRANIEAAQAEARDLVIAEARDPDNEHPFKGNIDLEALEQTIREVGRERVPFVLITVTNNSGGGQPVSLANLRGARAVCERWGVPLLLDCARFAENAYFIKLREPGYAEHTPLAIAREMFATSDGAVMSMKKDAFGNIGGVISVNSEEWAEKIRTHLILTEGFLTYGGLAGRDLEALSIGIREILDEDYLRYRIASTAYVGQHLSDAGVPLLKPYGGHAIYLDGRRFCRHLPDEQLPGWSLSVALYEQVGVRACEIGNVMFGRPAKDGTGWEWPGLDLVRLAIPRRVYTQSHMDYVVEGIIELFGGREGIRGLRFVHRPVVLPHFTATFAHVEA
ncbi:MAG TPA: tryptophanase [Thermoanaerobaculaceae bacterium]|nr:tryptophanase [Thermoanaerobaculaceae bacterium]